MKIALVHHWLTNMAGAERLLLELVKLYPDADIYTSVYDKSAMPAFEHLNIRTTWLQKMPFMRYRQQFWAPLRPFAFRSLDLSAYDLVISSDSAESKNVRVRADAVHISYNNTPIRYYWSHYHEYKADPGFGKLNFLIRLIMPPMVWWLKKLDFNAAQKVDYFISNSSEIKRRVKKYYLRNSVVINPPVSVSRFIQTGTPKKRHGYLIVGRQTPYKRFDLAIKACNELGLDLTVVGKGTEHERLKSIAGPTITFVKEADDTEIIQYFHQAEAFIFPAEEDFGIVPIEAMAAGMPVVAYAKGGVVDWMIEGKTGEVFKEQTVKSLVDTLKKFDPKKYSQKDLVTHAEKFNEERFRLEIKEFVDSVMQPQASN